MSLHGPPRIVAGLFASLALGMAVAGCTDPQGAGDRLARELPQVYPSQITATQFENNQPLDPPTLFIDLVPSMTPDQQLRFVCDELLPRVKAASDSIAVASGPYGWNDDDCE